MALRDFKVLTFDVVGTLIDFEGGMLAYLRQAVPGSDATDEQFLAAYRAARKSPDTDWYPNDLVRCWHVVAPQLGLPDMRHPIGYALNWPQRQPLPVAKLDLAALGKLTFRAPDETRYPALRLAREVMEVRGLAGAAFNAAKEIALDQFIAGHIGFMQMAALVEATLERLSAETRLGNAAQSLEDVLAMDHLARVRASEVAQQIRIG